ncbi:hypothetical protein C4D60_Mb04t25700 [Musa balbisiana]|uniref:LysM domain-containing protein n=1 Tax=Musa balbisiana TaxID=52838 RepID=A0A4V6T4S8_MUSBA|nr:hypothetical protein C4D60_Mb04t25700 [Musa balbisiana]
MIGKPAFGKGKPGSSGGSDRQGNARFLHEIEALSKALSVDPKQPRRPRSSSDDRRSISAGRSHLKAPSNPKPSNSDKQKDKKKPGSSSLWGWNPIKKALSHIGGHRRFDCCFSLHVHSIEGLPAALAGASLSVYWRRTTDPVSSAAATRPARVLHGAALFGESLTYRCSVHGARSGPGGTAKYEARHFLIYPALTVGAPGLDLGRHLVDLTRVLPATLEELEDAEKAFGKWSTSYRLSGKARGASLNVSFGFSLVGNNSVDAGAREREGSRMLNSEEGGLDKVNWQGSMVPVGSRLQHHGRCQSVKDVKVLHEVLPSSKSDALALANFESQAKPETSNDSKELPTLDADAKRELQIAVEQIQFTELRTCLVSELLEGTEEEPQLLDGIEVESHLPKPCILPEAVKGSDEQECDEPKFMVIEHGVEFVSKDRTCKTSADIEIDESAGDDKAGEARKEGLDTKPEEPVAEMAQQESHNLHDASLLTGEAKMEEGSDMKIHVPDAEEAEHDIYNPQEATLLAVDPPMQDLDSIFGKLSVLELGEFESPDIQGKPTKQLSHGDIKSNYKMANLLNRSRSLDAVTESVASEFLSMLGIEHSPFGLSSDSDPDSPRERLWKQFEKESLASGDNIFGLDAGMEKQSYWDELSDGLDLSVIIQEAETELQNAELAMNNMKSRAKMLEDAETEALMHAWGLNEEAFHCSPPGSCCGFGSPIDLPPEEPLELPPLGEGLGPIVQTKDGGFLRSMNPLMFRNAKNKENLIMQVSSPIVVPAEMGSGIMEILQRLASVGIEKLSRQASKLMPLEDITGKTMQQIAWDSATALDSCERNDLLENHYPETGLAASHNVSGRRKKGNGMSLASSSTGEMISEYVSLEDLAPMAMDKIEALSIEGLRIQTGMSDEEAPSNVSPQSIGEISALEGKGADNSWSLGLEGTAGLQLLDIKDSGHDVDGLMGLSITLDEWMKLDSGIIDEEDQDSDRTSKILAAHHANSMDLICGEWKEDKRGRKKSGRKWGLLGNNFTVALMVQLRNPLRNYEPVGTPMLALIQVERVFVPPKPKIYSTVSEKGNSEQEDEVETESKPLTKEEKHEEEVIPQYKITEVHVAGLKTEPNKRSLWGNPKQQQSGSRWLLATGMGKSNKHPFMKSKTVAKPSQDMTAKVQPGDTLWSISSRVHGTGAKWKELAALNPHIRNPNIILPNETIKLR